MYRKITLNKVEQDLAKLIAQGRQDNNKRRGVTNQKQSDRTDWDISLEGVAGELVACKYFNAYPDTDTELDPKDYPSADLITSTGIKVDVKTAKWDENSTYFETMWSTRDNERKNNADIDCYLFVRGSFPNYEICGWQTKEDHLKLKRPNKYGVDYYYCYESHLKRMDETYER